jgi:hypothetical protein
MVFLVKASTWPSYKESLVRRGQVLLDFDVLDGWDNELSHMNHGKVGEPRLVNHCMTMVQFLIQ